MHVVVIGLSHHSSPVTVRERFAFSEAKIPAALQLIMDVLGTSRFEANPDMGAIESAIKAEAEPPQPVRTPRKAVAQHARNRAVHVGGACRTADVGRAVFTKAVDQAGLDAGAP